VHQFTPRLRAVYRALGYQLRLLDAPRRINCTGDRTPAREVLAVHNL
jgi:DNA adenine methylase